MRLFAVRDLPLRFATARETLDFVQESFVLISSASAMVGEGGAGVRVRALPWHSARRAELKSLCK